MPRPPPKAQLPQSLRQKDCRTQYPERMQQCAGSHLESDRARGAQRSTEGAPAARFETAGRNLSGKRTEGRSGSGSLPLRLGEHVLKKTPLNASHRAAHARMVDFGGWDMPLHYG